MLLRSSNGKLCNNIISRHSGHPLAPFRPHRAQTRGLDRQFERPERIEIGNPMNTVCYVSTYRILGRDLDAPEYPAKPSPGRCRHHCTGYNGSVRRRRSQDEGRVEVFLAPIRRDRSFTSSISKPAWNSTATRISRSANRHSFASTSRASAPAMSCRMTINRSTYTTALARRRSSTRPPLPIAAVGGSGATHQRRASWFRG